METSQESRYSMIVSCYPVNHMSLDLAWWRNSRSVGWRSDYEGHQTKEASKEFKILFIWVIYKATWKAMKKKSCCFVSHYFFTWGWDQKSMDFNLQWEEGLSQVATVPALSKPLFMLAALINGSPLCVPICCMADGGKRCSPRAATSAERRWSSNVSCVAPRIECRSPFPLFAFPEVLSRFLTTWW